MCVEGGGGGGGRAKGVGEGRTRKDGMLPSASLVWLADMVTKRVCMCVCVCVILQLSLVEISDRHVLVDQTRMC